MAITLNINGVEVSCEKPEEAMLLASAASTGKAPKPAELAKVAERPVVLKINGAEMTCENPLSAAAVLVAAGVVEKPRRLTTDSRGAQGTGPARAWELAEAYAEKHGITSDEARRLIAVRKREIKARALVGQVEKKDQEFMQELKQLMDAIQGNTTPEKKKKK